MTDSPTSRVPAGVPTGGQFAATAHAEAQVTLTSLDTSAKNAEISDALHAITQMRKPIETLAAQVDDAMVACEVASDFPDAATVLVEEYDDGNGPDSHWTIKDADGEILDERIGSFRPDRLDDDEDGYTLDVQQVMAVDLTAAVAQAQADPGAAQRESDRLQHLARAQAFGQQAGMSTSRCDRCQAPTPHFYGEHGVTCVVCFH